MRRAVMLMGEGILQHFALRTLPAARSSMQNVVRYTITLTIKYISKGAILIQRQRDNACYLQFSHYLQFPEITHGIFTRLGGYSITPYKGLNASFSTGDSLENVTRNRLLVLQSLDLQAYPCATLWQVHGAEVATLDTEENIWDDWRADWPHRSYFLEDQELIWTIKARRKADAVITKQRGVALALTFGDCT